MQKVSEQIALNRLIQQALEEDLPNGDLTTDSLDSNEREGSCLLIAKEDLILSGQTAFTATMKALDPAIELSWKFQDGQTVINQQRICLIKGRLCSILKAERTALNLLGHLSGIATLTKCFTEKISGTTCKLLDTRKTTPTLRFLERKAVRDGSGFNHRLNLSSAIMLKENHLRLVGGITQAVTKIRETSPAPIIVECSTKTEVQEATENQVSRILLDNMSPPEIKEALELIPSSIETEASGNINLDNVKEYAETGIDFISVGKITHSAPCADFSLLFDWDSKEPHLVDL